MIEVRQEDREAGQDLYLYYPYQTVPGYLDDLIAGKRDDDVLIQMAATIRQQAEDAMRERCLAAVTRYRENCCYDEEMDAADVIATAIRGIDAGGEG